MPSKYIQIAALLQTVTQEVVYQSTMRLPTEMKLSQVYQVNRPTVRRALSLLTNEEQIEHRQESGSYIGVSSELRLSGIMGSFPNALSFALCL
jgi:DNA-binding GntR family transcriptional regulator